MASSTFKTLFSCAVALLLIALVSAGGASPCNADMTKLGLCWSSVSGSCAPPSKLCCKVLEQSNVPCLCSYKALMPALGINPKCALSLPWKCQLQTPPECKLLPGLPIP